MVRRHDRLLMMYNKHFFSTYKILIYIVLTMNACKISNLLVSLVSAAFLTTCIILLDEIFNNPISLGSCLSAMSEISSGTTTQL